MRCSGGETRRWGAEPRRRAGSPRSAGASRYAAHVSVPPRMSISTTWSPDAALGSPSAQCAKLTGESSISEPGSQLQRTEWPLQTDAFEYKRNSERYQNFLEFRDCRQLAIRGDGGLRGQGVSWWRAHWSRNLTYDRPTLLSLINCSDAAITDLSVLDPPNYAITFS